MTPRNLDGSQSLLLVCHEVLAVERDELVPQAGVLASGHDDRDVGEFESEFVCHDYRLRHPIGGLRNQYRQRAETAIRVH